MKKIKNKQLYITIIFTLIVCVTLWYMYDLFSFHTYNQRVYYDAIGSIENEVLAIDNYQIFQDEKSASYGSGTLVIKDSQKIIEVLPNAFVGETLDVIVHVTFLDQNNKEKEVIKNYNIFLEENEIFFLEEDHNQDFTLTFATLMKADVKLQHGKNSVTYPLVVTTMKAMKSATKEYRIEATSISHTVLRLGKLVASYDISKIYDTISLEYRYMKDKDGDIEDIDNYVVFKKLTATTKEYLQTNTYGVYIEDTDSSLEDKKVSVVVILSNAKSEYIFSMNMEIDAMGEQYE